MPLVDTPETPIPRYTHAITTKNEGDGNDVVYDRWIKYPKWEAVWDKFSYEDQLRKEGIVVTPPDGVPSLPSPPPPIISQPPVRGFRIVPITNESDGFIPAREYSYWPHSVIVGDSVYVLTCSSSGYPQFFRIDQQYNVTRMGSVINYRGEGEGWYFDKLGNVYLIDGPRLRRIRPFVGEWSDEVVFDISDKFPNHDLWQAHSSDDGQSHCATIREILPNQDTRPIAVAIAKGRRWTHVPAIGKLDESHITPDAGSVIIEEDDNNRIISVET